MTSLALTGGIATGKSTVARLFLELAPHTRFFDCDACVHELYRDPEVMAETEAAFGEVRAVDGTLDRAKLRDLVFNNPERRHALEAILHPRVRRACAEAQQAAAEEGREFFLADVPLLYESGFPMPRDWEVVVACTPEVQRQRLLARNAALSGETADQILAAQLPIADKMRRAGTVLWNGGSPVSLSHQTVHFVAWLRRKIAV
jgi:dephospho-CoA kinase